MQLTTLHSFDGLGVKMGDHSSAYDAELQGSFFDPIPGLVQPGMRNSGNGVEARGYSSGLSFHLRPQTGCIVHLHVMSRLFEGIAFNGIDLQLMTLLRNLQFTRYVSQGWL